MVNTQAPNNKAIRKVLIAGGGTAGWMAAATLSRPNSHLDLEIELVESAEIGSIGVGEATIPQLHEFLSLVEIDQAEFMQKCNATFKLGIEFRNWGAPGEHYLHPFTYHGVNYKDVSFFYLFNRYVEIARRSGLEPSLEDYNLCCAAARANRFRHPIANQDVGVAPLSYAFHFDASLFAKYLRDRTINRGVKHTEGRIVAVNQAPETGLITSVTLADGRELTADLFIDCTGLRALLIEQTLGSRYEDWRQWLPCDRAVAMPCAMIEPPVPYTQAIAEDSGWRWRIPLQNRTGNGMVYSSAFESSDVAEEKLIRALDGAQLADANHVKFTPGRRQKPWVKNCVSIGLSSGFLEPLESTNIHLIQDSMKKFMHHFPDKNFDQVGIDAYNKEVDQGIEAIRDFLILHYKVTTRDDSPFWRYCRTMDVPEYLTQRIDLFKARGRILGRTEDFFAYSSWLSVLYGQGLRPAAHVPQAEGIPDLEIVNMMNVIRNRINTITAAMAPHGDYLKAFCDPSRSPAMA